MRIAQVSPLAERVPPVTYGGTERIVSYLTEELVRRGHEVTLFASGDSRTSARLVPIGDRALRAAGCADPWAHHVLMLSEVFRRIDEFDLVHVHLDYLHLPLAASAEVPVVTTQHGRLDLPDLRRCFYAHRHLPFVSISDSQRRPMPWLNWARTIYHGLPLDLYDLRDRSAGGGGDYLAFIGRVSQDKRLDRAIDIAARAGLPLRVAAKVDATDPHERAYFDEVVRPLLDAPHVEFLGEVGDQGKHDILCRARALLFPIDWPEPFGMVMIEAMACGTPVIAWANGSVPEIIDEGVTGFVVDTVEDAVRAVAAAEDLDRRRVRDRFEARFSVQRMTDDHERLYDELVERRGRRTLPAWASGLGSARSAS